MAVLGNIGFTALIREVRDGSPFDTTTAAMVRSEMVPGDARRPKGVVGDFAKGTRVWTGAHPEAYGELVSVDIDELLRSAAPPDAEDRDAGSRDATEVFAGPAAGDDLESWLLDVCTQLCLGAQSSLTPEDLAATVLATLSSPASDDAIQGELFDVLGDFDAVGAVLSRRAELVEAQKQQRDGARDGRAGQRRGRGERRGEAGGFIQPAVQVVDRSRARLDRIGGPDVGGSSAAHRAADREAALRQFTDGVDSQDRVALPKDLVRTTHDGWEEYFLPAKSAGPRRTVALVPPKDILPPELLPSMAGVERLNTIQSTVWKTALRSGENMLICAPTGAGKTNIALLTVLRECLQFLGEDGRVQRTGWRVVYVAPMKALAAEVVEKFQERLRPLGLKVRELTGDMNLTRAEALDTQVVVVTPEKWDVVTRKSGGEGGSSVADAVSLLIIDEIHLLHEERGSVLESLVARTQRRAESEQRMIRLVGLSATLPNYHDVAKFLGVGDGGLYFFDASFRPVPLSQTFIGVQERNLQRRNERYLDIALDRLKKSLREKNQCMVFVHSRKDTLNTAQDLVQLGLFSEGEGEGGGDGRGEDGEDAGIVPTWALKEIAKFRASELRALTAKGIGIHHAGMLRADRKLVERLFLEGALQVLVCTATLAWGVNLPAHTVIIKGTQIYDAKRGGFVELSMLDVMQIFGRAGRPQFDTFGEGIILTGAAHLPHYLRLMTASLPIESRLQDGGQLPDHLNAEVTLGTVSSVPEGVKWLGYTYFAVRMVRNPLHYGVRWEEVIRDPQLHQARHRMISEAATVLSEARMVRFDERSGELAPTELGRIASHFYVSHGTISLWNESLSAASKDSQALLAVASASEFEQVRPREEEMDELAILVNRACPVAVKAGLDAYPGKVVTLLQAYVSRAPLRAFSLVSDTNYVAQSAARLMRALFEVMLRKGWPGMALTTLELSRSIDRRLWPQQHPLRQLSEDRRSQSYVPPEVCAILETAGIAGEVESLVDMTHGELTSLVRSPRVATQVRRAVRCIPALYVNAQVVPVTRSVLKLSVQLWPGFTWSDPVHGKGAEAWRLWVEDTEHDRIYHTERITLSRRQCRDLDELNPMQMVLTVPVFDPPSAHYVVSIESERWHGAGTAVTLSLAGLALPQQRPPHTDLLDLRPLPRSALGLDERILGLYSFEYFNALQTQMFWTLYHSDHNVLVGAPTGSGKTVTAELATLRAFRTRPGDLVVYVAPLKALVRERVQDWRRRLCARLGKTLVELTGDARASAAELARADVVVTTPEKWDGVSRGWRQRSYVRRVALLILDEVHLLGSDRGAVLEVLVSRTRRIGAKVRLVALSTALANPNELADWLGVDPKEGLFNFRPSVRPVPCEVHIQGVAGEHYCPRMIAMNRPTYAAILRYSPTKPTLVFVSSRRQTRLTALDLVRFAAADGSPRRFVAQGGDAVLRELAELIPAVHDESLRDTLEFGVGMHHAGLVESDRAIVERLFGEAKIQVLVSTSTLAWGVNLPAHLVVVKGTEFYDVKQHRYVDMPLTDLLQMIGRAGRPQFENRAFAVVLVHEPKKGFYKKFLYEPFPVESSLPGQLADHINAEIAAGTIATAQDAMDYLTWTYFFRRLLMNPAYYGLDRPTATSVSVHLSTLVEGVLRQLALAGCIEISEPESLLEEAHRPRTVEPSVQQEHREVVREMHTADPKSRARSVAGAGLPLRVAPLPLGHVAAYYYLSHRTMLLCSRRLSPDSTQWELLQLLADCEEFAEVPLRHNEDKLNEELWRDLHADLSARGAPADEILPRRPAPDWFSPHVKARLLMLAHISRHRLPGVDFGTNVVQDNLGRVLQAMTDIAAEGGMLRTTLRCIELAQQFTQRAWAGEAFLPLLADIKGQDRDRAAAGLGRAHVKYTPQLAFASEATVKKHLTEAHVSTETVQKVLRYRDQLPKLSATSHWLAAEHRLRVKLGVARAGSRRAEDSTYLVVHKVGRDELVAVKRVPNAGARESLATELALPPGLAADTKLGLLVMSDSFIGMDQDVDVVVGEAPVRED